VSATHVVSATLEPLEIARVTTNSAEILADATGQAIFVARFEVNENNGDTPTVTVDIFDGTTPAYLSAIDADGTTRVTFREKALAANQAVLFDGGYYIPKGSQLRVTSNNASGRLDVVGLMSRLSL
jgi:hypothetical protein